MSATPVLANDILLYPTRDIFNPRVPNVPPQPGGSKGHCYPLQLTLFSYPLKPYLQFPEGGKLSVDLRDDLHPAGNNFFALSDANYTLNLRRDDLGKKRQVRFVYTQGKTELSSVNLDQFPSGWSNVELEWDQTTAKLYRQGKEVAKVKLNAPFQPTTLDAWMWSVDELKITGDGQFSLDWESGYAAKVKLAAKPEALLIPRVFGFDSYVISLDQAKRDCPMVQLINTGPQERTTILFFALHNEVNQQKQAWQQKVVIPARSDVMVPVNFPFQLQSDVYHMAITADDTTPAVKENRNFLYVKLRSEPAGPHKFGINGLYEISGNYWPDALPIHLSQHFGIWYFVQGPAWSKWWNGDWGMDPDLPPEEWYWRPAPERPFYEGRDVYVCFVGLPAFPWMRSKSYGNENKQVWGLEGGVPNYEHYRKFLRAYVSRYKGMVDFYEVENEANMVNDYTGLKPEDYVQTAKAVYEEVKAVDPSAKVIGIAGTGNFTPWMEAVFNLGGDKYMDGVSWHTYTWPKMPQEAHEGLEGLNLPGNLAKANNVIAKTGKKMLRVNSETGIKVAMREEVDQALSDTRLKELIKEGRAEKLPWPNMALSERRGGAAWIQNITFNFLAGAEYFIFFGWNPSTEPGMGMAYTNWKDNCLTYSLFSASNSDGQVTPALHTLAVGVLTAQLEPAIHTAGRTINQDGIHGGVFPKKNGGEVAVLWSAKGECTLTLRSDNPKLELVNMLGQSSILSGKKENTAYTQTITIGEEPCYIHFDKPLTGFDVKGTWPILDSITLLPSSGVPQGTKVTVTVKAKPADPRDVLSYTLWTKKNTFTEFVPLYPASAAAYFPPPLTPGPGKINRPEGEWNLYEDVDGVFTFTADAAPGKYDISCGVNVVSGPNKGESSTSNFLLTLLPQSQPAAPMTANR